MNTNASPPGPTICEGRCVYYGLLNAKNYNGRRRLGGFMALRAGLAEGLVGRVPLLRDRRLGTDGTAGTDGTDGTGWDGRA